MKMADVLRQLADKLDGIEGSNASGDNMGKQASDFQHNVDNDANPAGSDTGLEDNPVMIPPLQQKLEILKKATGINNAFDNQGSDELDDIKKLTGIKAVVQHVAGEDNDITG
jgi:hypothetical protein